MSSASLAFDPPYKDVFADKITDNDDKLSLLIAKWDTVHQFAFPSRYVSGKFRRIQTHWFNDYFWLRYSQSACGVYCAPCYLFAGSVTRSLVSSVASDPSNFGKTLSRHTKSELHVNSVEAAENFRSIMSGEQKDIVASMSSSYNVLVERNRQILHAIVETIILCGRQNLSLRGHRDEDRGNFKALLEYQAKHNAILKDHLENGDPRTKYTSNKIQNEIIVICGDQIKSKIVESCNSVPFFGFIADEATDASTMEQMALCLQLF
ncbi:uncharacterized protein LOC128217527 [Mya arenaria]|uniref:uncharacterized protein LOC128217527 n=1 Tax=Mya arenaria TaxID=6604 RepID=UPI0022E2D11C|nr:uncharacterized protein LOC128217527 [Mya arenaria]